VPFEDLAAPPVRSRSWMRQGGGAGMIVVVVLELLYA
jgi:hypothetical protein